jgi:hypothetical protein
MIVCKSAEYGGGQTTSMPQTVAQGYLGNLIGKGTRLTNLSQALNQAFDGNGKASGSYTHDGHAVLHASAGKAGVSSVTLFFYDADDIVYLFAMGEHKDSSSYEVSDFGPATGAFKKGSTIRL